MEINVPRKLVNASLRKTNTNYINLQLSNGVVVYDLRSIGCILWFEYHCEESEASQDVNLWKRSHQVVEVLGLADGDPVFFSTMEERLDNGHPLMYKIRFLDGLEFQAFEDELLDSRSEFQRPDPPKQ